MKTLQQLLLEDDDKLRVKGNIIRDNAKLFFALGLEIDEFNGDFYCNNNNLTSLVGCPTTVNSWFDCSNNSLESLVGCPTTVNGNFNCWYNQSLTSLVGCPTIVNGNFSCSDNNLESLETGLPDGKKVFVKDNFNCFSQKNGKVFTEDEVRKYFDVKGKIYV